MSNSDKILALFDKLGTQVQTLTELSTILHGRSDQASLKSTKRLVNVSSIGFAYLTKLSLTDENGREPKRLVLDQLLNTARKKRRLILFAQLLRIDNNTEFLALNDARGGRRWIRLNETKDPTIRLREALTCLYDFEKKHIVIIPSGALVARMRDLVKTNRSQLLFKDKDRSIAISLEIYSHSHAEIVQTSNISKRPKAQAGMSHLDRLEAESIHIIREVMADADNPVMLYSVGKDSSVMLHLARKAFYPSPPPFPLLHVDTRWKFQAMYDFRDYMARESGMDLFVHINPEGVEKNINPFDHGSALHTDIMKTEGLKQALDHYKFDVAFGGARRDEEKSRAKERVFSFRNASHRWDPKNQRPELWNLYNGKKNSDESIRVFPISNWTELDIWQYIYREQIPIVPLYFAAERPVIERGGMLMMVDDDRLPLHPDEKIHLKKIRFRTLGCYPLTGAIESEADDLASIVLELLSARTSERQGRAIDADSSASMEKKKQEGYF